MLMPRNVAEKMIPDICCAWAICAQDDQGCCTYEKQIYVFLAGRLKFHSFAALLLGFFGNIWTMTCAQIKMEWCLVNMFIFWKGENAEILLHLVLYTNLNLRQFQRFVINLSNLSNITCSESSHHQLSWSTYICISIFTFG